MSAIFGIFHRDGKPASPQDILAMDNALQRFGSNKNGNWLQNTIALGSRQMSFTPEDEWDQQPLSSTTTKCTLVWAGRIDNRLELSHQLNLKTNIHTIPDSALLLQAYQKWGKESVNYLVGSFTFALWDANVQQLLIGRSPFAEQTLFYFETPHIFIFSTRPKGLFALPNIERRIDEQYVAAYLTLIDRPFDRTFFKNIKQLQGGHTLLIGKTQRQIRHYWQANTTNELQLKRDEDYVDAFNDVFMRVVSSQLRTNSSIGIMLSGGLDSSSIASIAATQLGTQQQNLNAFTEVPSLPFNQSIAKGRYADETPYIRALVSQYSNIDSHFIHADGFYLDKLECYFDASEAPFPAASNRLWMEEIFKRAAGYNVRSILTGLGGNLTISWSGKDLLPQLIRRGRWAQVIREARAIGNLREIPSTTKPLFNSGVLPLLPYGLWQTIMRARSKLRPISRSAPWEYYSPIHPDFAHSQQLLELASVRNYNPYLRKQVNFQDQRLQTLFSTDAISTGIYADCRNYGVEMRNPALDSRLIEFCFSLPEEQCLRLGQDRWILRRAMATKLPTEILSCRERGLQCADWFTRYQQAQPRIFFELDKLRSSVLASSIIDLTRLEKLTEKISTTSDSPEKRSFDYRFVLESGLMMGCFLRWVETAR